MFLFSWQAALGELTWKLMVLKSQGPLFAHIPPKNLGGALAMCPLGQNLEITLADFVLDDIGVLVRKVQYGCIWVECFVAILVCS